VKHILWVGIVLCLVGCAKDINNKEAVKAAIEKRVAKTGFDVNAMQVDVRQVSFHDQDAVATVAFVPKDGPPQSAVTFKYNLHRQKDEWVATGLAQGGSGMSGGHPAAGAGGGTAGPLPDNAGPTLDGSQPLPSGHPPIGRKQ
jgi:hypothetical protein